MITVTRHPNKNPKCAAYLANVGGVKGMIQATFVDGPFIAMYDEDGTGLFLSRDEVVELQLSLNVALADA